jgi:hypothetical protein
MLTSVVLCVISPLLMTVGILASTWIAWRQKLIAAKALMWGGLYILVFWLLLLVVINTGTGGEEMPLAQVEIDFLPSFLTLLCALPIWRMMLVPSRQAATQLILQGKGLAAGIISGSCMTACLLSWVSTAVVLYLAF